MSALISPREKFVPLGESEKWIEHVTDLQMRLPKLVWACGESFETSRLSVGSELLRYGFKEWAGIREMSTLRGVTPQGQLTREGVAELLDEVMPTEDGFDRMPIVVCRDVHAPARIIERSAQAGRVSMAFAGATESAEMQQRRSPFVPALPPIPIPADLTPDSILWLGVGRECERSEGGRPDAAAHVRWLEKHFRRTCPLSLWLVVQLDQLRLGRSGHGWLDEGVVASLMRSVQSWGCYGGVVLLSETKASPAGPGRVGESAQMLGRALHRPRWR
jgi:hypothetical protein